MPSAWIAHVKSVYAKGKGKGMSYKQAMVAAKSSYKRAGKSAEPKGEEDAAPKKRRRKKKASLSLSKAHTKGLGNIEEGRAAEAAKPKKKRQRKRPVLGKAFKALN